MHDVCRQANSALSLLQSALDKVRFTPAKQREMQSEIRLLRNQYILRGPPTAEQSRPPPRKHGAK